MKDASDPLIPRWLLVALAVTVYLFLVVYARGSPTGKALGRMKHCQANLRVLKEAMAMYRLDHPEGPIPAAPVAMLREGMYLKGPLECPGERGVTGTGTFQVDGDSLRCTFHGTDETIEQEVKAYQSFFATMGRGMRRLDPGAFLFIPIFVD